MLTLALASIPSSAAMNGAAPKVTAAIVISKAQAYTQPVIQAQRLPQSPAGPGVDAAGQQEPGNDLGEDEHDEELADPDEGISDRHRWAGGGQGEGEQGVDADHRRQVREAEREFSHSVIVRVRKVAW